MIDLVITHLTHPWGPPGTLETLGDPWRPLATLGDHASKWSFWPIVLKGLLILSQKAKFGLD